MLISHQKGLKAFVLSIFVFSILALISIRTFPALGLSLTKVTGGVDSTKPASQIFPEISGDKVIWLDTRYGEGSFAIYMKDLTLNQESEIAYVSTYNSEPNIDGDRIVWSDICADGSNDIFMKTIGGSTTAIVNTAGYQRGPKISGNNLIWTDYGTGLFNIRLYAKNLSSGAVTLLKEGYGIGSYEISGNIVVWEDYQNMDEDGSSDIYMKNLATGVESAVCTAQGDQFAPAISGNTVVWVDNREGEDPALTKIYKKELISGVEAVVASLPSPLFSSPSISGDNVVWSELLGDSETSESCIKSKNLTTGVVKTFGILDSYNDYPRISGNSVVWFNCNIPTELDFDFNADVSITDISNDDPGAITTTVNSNATQKATPNYFCMAGNKVVWSDDRTGDYELYLKDITSGVESPISNNTGSQERYISDQALEGNKLTWTNSREVWVKDIATGSESVAASSTAYKSKSIYSGNRVIWQEQTYGNENIDTRIYSKAEGGLPVLIASSSSNTSIRDFSASGDKVIWSQSDINGTLYLKDLATGITSVVAGPGDMIWNPRISGNNVIWEVPSYGGEAGHIYLKAVDVPSRPQVTFATFLSESLESYPSISGDIVVWFETNAGQTVVKCKSISTGAVASVASITADIFMFNGAQVSNGYTAWFDNRDRGISIYARSIDSTTLGDPAPVYRFYNFKQGVHFYTTNAEEKANLQGPAGNWTFRYEGNRFEAQVMQLPNSVPVYRFYNFIQGAHFYTANQAEASNVNDNLWNTFRYEGVAYYAYPPTASSGKAPVYRFYNFLQGVHFYTTNPAEKANLESSAGNWTFRYEGIAYYAPQ